MTPSASFEARMPLTPPAVAPPPDVALAFDRMADGYDAAFTESLIGRAQRNVVWNALAMNFRAGNRVLELNCGTGEDALFLARRGVSVLGCDAAPRMITVAERRKSSGVSAASLDFRVLRNEELDAIQPSAPFDGAFSNFSGLNCVEDMSPVARQLARLVKPGGTALFCFSTRICLWEIAWYSLRGNFKKALRRVRGATLARLNELSIPVWYPTLSEIRRSFAPFFRLDSTQAVGLCVPPSYVEPWAQRHRSILRGLETMDQRLSTLPLLRALGDHMLLEFRRTTEPPIANRFTTTTTETTSR
jgi:ubiquinone/menaquinone biosynthesis C-methylase UbiE